MEAKKAIEGTSTISTDDSRFALLKRLEAEDNDSGIGSDNEDVGIYKFQIKIKTEHGTCNGSEKVTEEDQINMDIEKETIDMTKNEQMNIDFITKTEINIVDYKTEQMNRDTVIKFNPMNSYISKDDSQDKEDAEKDKNISSFKKRNFNCDFCDLQVVSFYELQEHIFELHWDVTVERQTDLKYCCNACDFKSLWLWNVKMHILGTHIGIRPHACSDCDYRATKSSDLKRHVMIRHEKKESLVCPSCDYKTVGSWNLKTHISSKHKSEKPYSCSKCEFKTIRQICFKRHILKKHNPDKKKFMCPLCNYSALVPSYLRRHLKKSHAVDGPKF